MAVLFTIVTVVFPLTTIRGYSQWSGLVLIESNGHWNFLNRTTHFMVDCSIFNCYNARTDARKCPTELSIVASELKTIPKNLFANCFTRLKFLKVSNCGIWEISRDDFTYADNLIKLDLSHNQISKVPKYTFELAPKVEIIDLSNNRIETHGIEEFAFEKSTSLKQLNLTNNSLKYISSDWLAPLTSLEVLDLSNFGSKAENFAFATTAFYNNTNLISLYARNSKGLMNIDAFEYADISIRLPKLKHLIAFWSYRYEKWGTDVTKYHQEKLDTNLTIFDLSGKFLGGLIIPNSFKIVIVNYNQIESSTLKCSGDNRVVTEFYINHNYLTNIDIVEKLPNLEIADFSSNFLQVVNETILVQLTHLVELNLANNQLKELNTGILERIPSIKAFDTSDNAVTNNDCGKKGGLKSPETNEILALTSYFLSTTVRMVADVFLRAVQLC